MSAKEVKKLADMAIMQTRLRLLSDAAVKFFEISMFDLKHNQASLYAWPRMICMALAATRYPKSDIARYWGKDASLPGTCAKKVKHRMETEPSSAKEVEQFLQYATRYILKEEKNGSRFG